MIPTIFASATPAGRSALSILRISGPRSFPVLSKLAPRATFTPRQSKLTRLYNNDNLLLDEALVLTFQAPHSFTGDDMVELYLHGSPAVDKAVKQAIISTNMARHAEPGEFTKRAFYNNRLDLTQVEGIRDLIASETEMQRQASIGGASGKLSHKFETWRSQLVESSAIITANIDFSEDNGLSEDGNTDLVAVSAQISKVRADIALAVSASSHCSELVKQGIRVALLGEPNSGKSSLTNHLAQRSACLVSDIPGTTRDVIEVALELDGHKFVIFDTAGLRKSSDTVEQLGVHRAREIFQEAHIVINLLPANQNKQTPEIITEVNKLKSMGKKVISVRSKSDLAPDISENLNENNLIWLSTITGEGIEKLAQELSNHANQLMNAGTNIFNLDMGLSIRSQSLLRTEVISGLTNCLELLNKDIVLANAELQRAVHAIGIITGKDISVHEVLDVVFGEFCIGK